MKQIKKVKNGNDSYVIEKYKGMYLLMVEATCITGKILVHIDTFQTLEAAVKAAKA